MLRISHPRPELGRQTFLDVEFIDGTAEILSLHPERRLALEQHGFAIAAGVEPDLGRMTKAALTALAVTNRFDLPPRASAKVIRGILSEIIALPDPEITASPEGS